MDVQKVIEERLRLLIGELQVQNVILSAKLDAAIAELQAKQAEIDALKPKEPAP